MSRIVNEEARARLLQSLRHAMGEAVMAAVVDKGVVEIMVNPDGQDLGGSGWGGRAWTGERLEPFGRRRILRRSATHPAFVVTADQPRVRPRFPETGDRFHRRIRCGRRPMFRDPQTPGNIFRLDGEPTPNVGTGVMRAAQASVNPPAVIDRQNIVVAGGTGRQNDPPERHPR